ncbi:MAG: cation transporter [Bacteroidales bacterium]|nr:cation transporter [Bacteroidales bacterium]
METTEKRLDKAYLVSIALNVGFVVLEVAVALASRSLGLMSDAGHKLIDVFALIIALVGFRLARRSDGKDYGKVSAGIALFNALILLVAVAIIVAESIAKFSNPEPVNGAAISWTAGVGIIVSGLSAWLLMRHRGDINTRAAFLHMATDSLLSLGVVISGIVISLTGLHVIDPAVSLVIAAVILFNTVRIIRDALKTLLAK